MNNEIIWVDDEPLWGERHIDKLRESNYTVHPFDNVNEANDAYGSLIEVNGVVLDIMMPGGDLFTEEMTVRGLKTGLLLLALWKDRLIARKQPVFVLTNRDVAQVRVEIAALRFPQGFTRVLHKKETSPTLFPDQLSLLLKANGVYRS